MQERQGVRDRGPLSIPGARDKAARITAAEDVSAPVIEKPVEKAENVRWVFSNRPVKWSKYETVPAYKFTKIKAEKVRDVEEIARREGTKLFVGDTGWKPEKWNG